MSVSDLEADEIVSPSDAGLNANVLIVDQLLALIGVLLAVLATFFPWYVFFNQDQFSLPTLWRGETRDLSSMSSQPVVSISPLAMTNSGQPASDPLTPDPLTTSAVPGLTKQALRPAAAMPEPTPAQNRPFRLMHAANGRALVEDGYGMYLVQVGSVLPDNSRLATLEQRAGNWVLITSNGDVIERR